MNDPEDLNPYSPPEASLTREPNEEAERVRRKYFRREFLIKAVSRLVIVFGWLQGVYALGFFGLNLFFFVGPMILRQPLPEPRPIDLAASIGGIGIAFVSIVVGRGLYRLRPWARKVGGYLSIVLASALFILAASLSMLNPRGLSPIILVFMAIDLIGSTILFAFGLMVLSSSFSYIFTPEYGLIVEESRGFRPWRNRPPANV